jgi:[ribosomal protein S5]-alanine N-acetyltransferase
VAPLASLAGVETARLRLEPVGPGNARDLWLVHGVDDWGQLYDFLPDEPWVRAVHEARRPFVAHRDWLEVGWALRAGHRGHGYAAELGRAALAYAFDSLGARAVVSCTIRHNVRSRAVMERIGMRYTGEIRSRGLVEGLEGQRDDAPYAVCVLLRDDYRRVASVAPAL